MTNESENQIDFDTNFSAKVERMKRGSHKKSVVIVVVESCLEENDVIDVVIT